LTIRESGKMLSARPTIHSPSAPCQKKKGEKKKGGKKIMLSARLTIHSPSAPYK
jgi:hypothetical protein